MPCHGRVCWFYGRKISRTIFRVPQVENHLSTYTVGEQTFILEEFACCQRLQSQIQVFFKKGCEEIENEN